MLQKDKRRGKKRQREGVTPLPPVHKHSESVSGVLGQDGNFVATGVAAKQGQGSDSQKQDTGGSTGAVRAHLAAGRGTREELYDIFREVVKGGRYNAAGARRRVPSALNIEAWRKCLANYSDGELVDFLEFGWPVNFRRGMVLQSTLQNHASALQNARDIEHYICTELTHGALMGPFGGPPVRPTHVSPLMTRPKKNSKFRRVIMDLSWPAGESVNDGVDGDNYLDGPARVRLPTVEYMEQRVLELGPGCYLYKTDLARGYRQLRVDPLDWPLLGFMHEGKVFLDVCPPFGLKTSAMCMQRTAEAICYIHGQRGFYSRAYLDDFGGGEATEQRASRALRTLQRVMQELGVREAEAKICLPAQTMVWLGILFDTVNMTMSVPQVKLQEVMEIVQQWQGRVRASRHDMQKLLGLLQFVASVAPPARVFTNRMLQGLREAPAVGAGSLSLGFKQDVAWFARMLPEFNGVKLMVKQDIQCQALLQLDACLTGCGAFNGQEFYSEPFPTEVLEREHPIARLELLNVVLAVKLWAPQWAHKRVRIHCDNMNACVAMRTGRARDEFFQACVRELFVHTVRHDVELIPEHRPGVLMQTADALSRAPADEKYRRAVERDPALKGARRVRVDPRLFRLVADI